MAAVAWTAIGINAALVLFGFVYLNAKLSNLESRLEARISKAEKGLDARIDAQVV